MMTNRSDIWGDAECVRVVEYGGGECQNERASSCCPCAGCLWVMSASIRMADASAYRRCLVINTQFPQIRKGLRVSALPSTQTRTSERL